MGQAGVFRDGRFLRDIVTGSHVLYTVAGPGVTAVGPLQIQRHDESRALLLDWIEVNSIVARINVQVEWQIFSDSYRIANGMISLAVMPLGLYLPPYSNQSFYMRVTNNTLAPPINLASSTTLRFIEFDVEGDKYDLGKGTNANNPAFVDVVWPTFPV